MTKSRCAFETFRNAASYVATLSHESCHWTALVSTEAAPAPAGLPFDAVERNRPSGGGFYRSGTAGRAKRVCGQAGVKPCEGREPVLRGRLHRSPRGAPATLKRPAAGSDRSENEGQTGGSRAMAPKPGGQNPLRPTARIPPPAHLLAPKTRSPGQAHASASSHGAGARLRQDQVPAFGK
ncbi:hypothetical protein GFL18_32535 [Rhizobium leguminosarum bv. viciae]|nr:hypothetical protein [Rhizobium leguminosarum bv. viciae]